MRGDVRAEEGVAGALPCPILRGSSWKAVDLDVKGWAAGRVFQKLHWLRRQLNMMGFLGARWEVWKANRHGFQT